ncbi:tight adherence pilus pseudopilin TadF [Photobacterium kagoshimensis]|uniref:tight adherence pilus pseudopilin TadF n=1 Tax=Photobacterium kagoshimensis TaxID=2910242 RepID=UPI003D13E678
MQINKQKGVFSIELAFVLIGMTSCLYFCFDLGFQQIRKSQLERTAHSLVSLLKERSLFYPSSRGQQFHTRIQESQAQQLQLIGAKLLNSKVEDVSVIIEERLSGKHHLTRQALSPEVNCAPPFSLASKKLDITREKQDKYAPIYQVTICQRIPAWFERIMGNDPKKTDRILTSYSTFIGR